MSQGDAFGTGGTGTVSSSSIDKLTITSTNPVMTTALGHGFEDGGEGYSESKYRDTNANETFSASDGNQPPSYTAQNSGNANRFLNVRYDIDSQFGVRIIFSNEFNCTSTDRVHWVVGWEK